MQKAFLNVLSRRSNSAHDRTLKRLAFLRCVSDQVYRPAASLKRKALSPQSAAELLCLYIAGGYIVLSRLTC